VIEQNGEGMKFQGVYKKAAVTIRDRVPDEQLLERVWSPELHLEPRTGDVNIRRLPKAINAHQEHDLIRTVRSAGYALHGKEEGLAARSGPSRHGEALTWPKRTISTPPDSRFRLEQGSAIRSSRRRSGTSPRAARKPSIRATGGSGGRRRRRPFGAAWPAHSRRSRRLSNDVREPVCGPYRIWIVCGMPPPSSGGVTVLHLGLLERFSLAATLIQ
jgi:hypothetical protein